MLRERVRRDSIQTFQGLQGVAALTLREIRVAEALEGGTEVDNGSDIRGATVEAHNGLLQVTNRGLSVTEAERNQTPRRQR